MKIVHRTDALKEEIAAARARGLRIALVPTMGALHAGHVSLVEIAKRRGFFTVMSIFVNPLQFNDPQDLAKYPRTLEADSELASANGVDLLFVPGEEEIYPKPPAAGFPKLTAGSMGAEFEGRFRPGHFDGVVTVVNILFRIVTPDLAVFGEKDYQQLRVIRQMAADQSLPIEIVEAPLLRDPDGLAMSSRNRRLSSQDRALALRIPGALREASQLVKAGERNARSIVAAVRNRLEEQPALKVDYAVVIDQETFKEVPEITINSRILIAAWVGQVRLIDTINLGRGSIM